MNADFITLNGLVCKNEGKRLLMVCLAVKYFWFESTGIDYNAVQCLKENQLYKK